MPPASSRSADNVALYNARFYEGRYIIGQIAAKMSKAGLAGYIVSFPIPEVVMGINSFMLGAQSVNPDFKVKIVWVNTWFDPGKEADAAKALFDQGADIIVQHTDSTAPLQIAEERGLHGFGQASDMIKFAPKAQLHLDRRRLGAVLHRAASRSCSTAPGSRPMSGKASRKAPSTWRPTPTCPTTSPRRPRRSEQKIASGEFHPFTGPIFKQDGTEVIPAGQVMDDGTLLGMNWYVKGIDDQLPQ